MLLLWRLEVRLLLEQIRADLLHSRLHLEDHEHRGRLRARVDRTEVDVVEGHSVVSFMSSLLDAAFRYLSDVSAFYQDQEEEVPFRLGPEVARTIRREVAGHLEAIPGLTEVQVEAEVDHGVDPIDVRGMEGIESWCRRECLRCTVSV